MTDRCKLKLLGVVNAIVLLAAFIVTKTGTVRDHEPFDSFPDGDSGYLRAVHRPVHLGLPLVMLILMLLVGGGIALWHFTVRED